MIQETERDQMKTGEQTKECLPTQECPFCKSNGGIIWIHGHGQCVHCQKNIEPCCEGEKPIL